MYSTWKFLISAIFLVNFAANLQGVYAGRIPGPAVNGLSRRSGREVVKISGWEAIARYGCPKNADIVKRQELGPVITVPKNQLRDFLKQLRLLELETIALIDSLFSGDGTTTTSSSDSDALPTITLSSVPLASLSSAIDSALAVTITASASLCAPEIPTITITRTLTITPPPITITMTSFPWTTKTTHSSSKRPGMVPYLNTTLVRTRTELVHANSTVSFRHFNTSVTTTSVLTSNRVFTTTLDRTPAPSASLTTPSSTASRSSTSSTTSLSSTGSTTSPSSTSSRISTTLSKSSSSSSITPSGGIFLQTSATILPSTPSSSLETGLPVETVSSSLSGGSSTQGLLTISTMTSSTTISASMSSTSALPTTSTSPEFFEQPTNSTGYQFNATSTSNVAVYFGQTPVTGGTTMEAQCADPNVDIVILAFVISMTGQYPILNFGAACGGLTAKMAAEAPGLFYCPELATSINNCQQKYGKKVLLSIGGSTSQFSLATAADASNFANTLWNLFGPPGNIDIDLRPFGTVAIDGFDIDKEDRLPENWDTLATSLRSHYETSTKKYYLSSAPQCPFPDESNPSGLLLLCDFVFVQFYNNPPCEIGSAGFTASVKQWSKSLEASTLVSKPRLYVGAPAFAAAGPSAYANLGGPEGIREVAAGVEHLGLPNFGGVMFWDGPEGMLNVEEGKDIIAYAKEGLIS